MEELIKRLQSAPGPSIELDAAIELAIGKYDRLKLYPDSRLELSGLGDKWVGVDVVGPLGGRVSYTEYPHKLTSSIDAALTLVPNGLTWQITGRVKQDGDYFADVDITHRCDSAPNPAIALCIAALLARKDS